ncbi:hypothetical protein EJ06DRAFT_485767 [Trichodelitschia bisporula]|uniref:intramembrane prenyl-peptidase Rce1 n=1 Tax=Trichodelitschia bisporula TaxID=703511 RepID=A0A6G1IB45_9PEZI|nr:hypothetical protein EJ06DRAFT_485767 [Trichodelitschia bisporula]
MAPVGLYHRLKSYYSKEPREIPPAISTQSAAALSILFTVVYVLPFYLSKATRPSPTLSRDAPSVIRARIRAVTSACIICSIAVLLIIFRVGKATVPEALHLLGWWPVDVLAVLRTLLLCIILFAGPLFEAGFAEGRLKQWMRGTPLVETLSSWTGWRNYVAGPVTEELVFRSLLIPLHLLAKMTPGRIVFLTPLYFGIAHVHHFYEFTLTHPEAPVLLALVRSLVQFTYTSLFGFFAAFVFLRTGSVYAAIAAHSFCNWMGLPRFWGRVGVQAGVPISPPGTKRDDERAATESPGAVRDGRLGIAWTVVYYLLLIAGAFGFYQQFWLLTQGSAALVQFQRGK